MPRGDRTGPLGMGPMTGRGAGYCAGYAMPGYANPGPGRGIGLFGGRGGRGYRHWYYATGLPGWIRFGYAPGWGTPPPAWQVSENPPAMREQEVEFLKKQAAWLKEQLRNIEERMAELEQPSGGESGTVQDR